MPEISPMDLQNSLPALLPAVIAWAENQAALVVEHGLPLTPAWMEVARRVGVMSPERIRIMLVEEMPQPEDAQLRQTAARAGLLGAGTAGLTLGYAILVLRGCDSVRLVSHECRHVHQYEKMGSIAAFMPVYLQQVLHYGYEDAPLEVDARAHEIETA